MTKKFVIYSITNPSGSVYVGQTVNAHKRINRYRVADCKSQRYLYKSILKYGWGNHVFTILHELPNDVDRKIMDQYELFYYEQFNSTGTKMMNLKQAFGRGGGLHPETIEKLRQANLRRIYKPCSEETKAKLRLAHTGKKYGPRSIDAKKKMSEWQKGRKTGRKLTERQKELLNAGRRATKTPQEGRDRIRKARSIPIIQYDGQGNFIKEWEWAKIACKELNLHRGNMCNVLAGANNNFYKEHKFIKKIA